jgi:hypothetical protein
MIVIAVLCCAAGMFFDAISMIFDFIGIPSSQLVGGKEFLRNKGPVVVIPLGSLIPCFFRRRTRMCIYLPTNSV